MKRHYWLTIGMEKFLRALILSGFFASAFLPLIIANGWLPNLPFPFITGKAFAFRFISEIMFVAWALLALRNPLYRPKISPLLAALLWFFGIVALADVLGVNVYKSIWSNFERMEGLILFAHLVAYLFVLVGTIRTETVWRRYFALVIGVGVFSALYALAQYAGIFSTSTQGTRPDTTFGNAAYLAAYLLFIFFLTVYLWTKQHTRSARFISGIAGAVTLAGIFVTGTRGAVLGLSAGIIIFGLLYLVRWNTRRAIIVGAVTVILAGGLLSAISYEPISALQPVTGGSRFSLSALKSDDARARFTLWNIALQGVAERPLFGWGQENFNYVFNAHYAPTLYGREEWYDRVHNVFLDWLVAAGIFGLLSYLLIFGALGVLIWRPQEQKETKQKKTESAFSFHEKALISSFLIAYLVQNFFVFDSIVSYILFFTLCAYIEVRASSVKAETVLPRSSKQNIPSPNEGMLGAQALFGFAALLFVLWTLNIQPMRAGRLFTEAATVPHAPEQVLSRMEKAISYNTFGTQEIREGIATAVMAVGTSREPNITLAMRQKFFNFAQAEIEKNIAEAPQDARLLAMKGYLFAQFGLFTDAAGVFERVLSLSPRRPALLFALGSSYLEIGNKPSALKAFQEGYALAPENTEARIVFAAGNIYTGDATEAERIIALLRGTLAAIDRRILNAYVNTRAYGKAIALVEEHLYLAPRELVMYTFLAETEVKNGKTREALQWAKKAVELDPNLAPWQQGLLKM